MKLFLKVIAVVLCVAIAFPMYAFGWENSMTVITPPDRTCLYEGVDWGMTYSGVSVFGDLDLTGLVLGYNGEEVPFQSSRWGPNIFCEPVSGKWNVGDNQVYFIADDYNGMCAQGTMTLRRIKNVSIVRPPYDTTYIRGVDWDYNEKGEIALIKPKLDGIILEVVCTDDYTYYFDNAASIRGSLAADDYVFHIGKNQLCAWFMSTETPFDIDIEMESISKLTKEHTQYKTDYAYGTDWRYIRNNVCADIDLSGLSVKATYNNGTQQVLSYDECPERFSLPDNLKLSAGNNIIKVLIDSEYYVNVSAFLNRYGDMDFNGVLNSTDALLILRGVVGITELSEEQLMYADVNDDGLVNSYDALQVLNRSVELITLFDAEI